MNRTLFLVFAGAALVCGLLYVFAPLDLLIAQQFHDGTGFPWRAEALPNFFHDVVHPLALALAAVFAALTLWHYSRKTGWRRWAFLLLSLIMGPGLLTNTLFKDNWGRARPIQIEQFGGSAHFSPPFVISDQCDHNCSFVAGDPAFAFWLHSAAYVAARRRRQIFFAGLGAGVFYGVLRIGMGAHFFSDVVCAGMLMLASSASLFALMFGRQALRVSWQGWLTPRRSC